MYGPIQAGAFGALQETNPITREEAFEVAFVKRCVACGRYAESHCDVCRDPLCFECTTWIENGLQLCPFCATETEL